MVNAMCDRQLLSRSWIPFTIVRAIVYTFMLVCGMPNSPESMAACVSILTSWHNYIWKVEKGQVKRHDRGSRPLYPLICNLEVTFDLQLFINMHFYLNLVGDRIECEF